MEDKENRRDAFEIFEEIFAEEEQSARSRQEGRGSMSAPLDDGQFYEIEYDSAPFPGVGKFVLKSSKIQTPPRDEIREKFDRMRDIARENRFLYFNSSKFYDKRVRQENAGIFCLQGDFMADFEDDYEKSQPYSAYYPSYQTMGYEQLRTYFTWRTQVRQGNIEGTSLSYAFLYIYELINLIGMKSPEEGSEMLLLFWDAYRQFDRSIDKYMPGWLKDFYIYYELEGTFQEFVEKNKLEEWYPDLTNPQEGFDLLCSISKYDLRSSAFYGEGNEELVRSCFDSTMERLEHIFGEAGIELEELVFQPVKNMPEWLPFKGALFCPRLAQDDRKVVISDKEVFVCCRDRWTFQTTLTTESGKRLMGYVMKQMEASLRKAVKYRHKLSANPKMLGAVMAQELEVAGIALEESVENAVEEFIRERNKTVVKVDAGALERIRQEALITQEKLTVPENGNDIGLSLNFGEKKSPMALEKAACIGQGSSGKEVPFAGEGSIAGEAADIGEDSSVWKAADIGGDSFGEDMSFKDGHGGDSEAAPSDPWKALGNALNETERQAVAMALRSYRNMKQFADEHGIMLEVLMDGINEKAMDHVGDSLLDEEFTIYDDYLEQAREMMEEIWQGR